MPADFYITFEGGPVTDGTMLDNSIIQNSTVHFNHRLLGGAKKGIKKLTKQEKLAALRATTLYRAQASPGIDQVIIPLSGPNFMSASIQNMAPDSVIALNEAITNLKQVREDPLTTTITPFFVPQVNQWKQQIALLENNIEVVESAMSTVFCDTYYGSVGFDYDSFFQTIQARVDQVEADRLRAQIQAETIAAMQAAPVAAAVPMDAV